MVAADPYSESAQAAAVISEDVVDLGAKVSDVDVLLDLSNREPVSEKRLKVIPVGISESGLGSSSDLAPRHGMIHVFPHVGGPNGGADVRVVQAGHSLVHCRGPGGCDRGGGVNGVCQIDRETLSPSVRTAAGVHHAIIQDDEGMVVEHGSPVVQLVDTPDGPLLPVEGVVALAHAEELSLVDVAVDSGIRPDISGVTFLQAVGELHDPCLVVAVDRYAREYRVEPVPEPVRPRLVELGEPRSAVEGVVPEIEVGHTCRRHPVPVLGLGLGQGDVSEEFDRHSRILEEGGKIAEQAVDLDSRLVQ